MLFHIWPCVEGKVDTDIPYMQASNTQYSINNVQILVKALCPMKLSEQQHSIHICIQ